MTGELPPGCHRGGAGRAVLDGAAARRGGAAAGLLRRRAERRGRGRGGRCAGGAADPGGRRRARRTAGGAGRGAGGGHRARAAGARAERRLLRGGRPVRAARVRVRTARQRGVHAGGGGRGRRRCGARLGGHLRDLGNRAGGGPAGRREGPPLRVRPELPAAADHRGRRGPRAGRARPARRPGDARLPRRVWCAARAGRPGRGGPGLPRPWGGRRGGDLWRGRGAGGRRSLGDHAGGAATAGAGGPDRRRRRVRRHGGGPLGARRPAGRGGAAGHRGGVAVAGRSRRHRPHPVAGGVAGAPAPGGRRGGPMTVLRLHPDDTVAVAVQPLAAGAVVALPDGQLTVRADVPAGHKVALADHAGGAPVRKYGQVIGVATATIGRGDHVHSHNLGMGDVERDYAYGVDVREPEPVTEPATFQGIRRPDGRVATRNYLGILTSVNCSATAAKLIAERFRGGALEEFPQVDGVVALTHGSGCGMALGDGLELLRRTLTGYARHPNFAGFLLLGLGCEVNQVAALTDGFDLPASTPVVDMTIQELGGT